MKASAELVSGKDRVEGYLIELFTPSGYEQRYGIDVASAYDSEGNSVSVYQVDPETLQYQIGDEWYTMEEIEYWIQEGKSADDILRSEKGC